MFIDTHTHIYLKDFIEDRNEIIQECSIAKVDKLLLPNIDSSTIEEVVKLSKDYQKIFVFQWLVYILVMSINTSKRISYFKTLYR